MQPEEEAIPPSDAPPPTQDDGWEFGQGEREDYMGRQEASFEGEVLLGSGLVIVDSSFPSRGCWDGTSLTRHTSQQSGNQPGDKVRSPAVPDCWSIECMQVIIELCADLCVPYRLKE